MTLKENCKPKRKRGRPKGLVPPAPPEWACDNCGNKFKRWPSWFRSGVIGCSHKCTLELKSKKSDHAYWERNMLALLYADGWYEDLENNWPGWKRVLSLHGGTITFHIPDDFDVLNLPQIKPNWDGHTTEEKWERVKKVIESKWVDGEAPIDRLVANTLQTLMTYIQRPLK